MTKVLMTADAVGGVFTYAADLAAALRRRGTDVVLATFGASLSEGQRRMVDGVRVHSSTLALEWMPDPWADVARAEQWLLELEAAERPDIVHLNGYAHGAAPFRAPTLVVGHSCVLSWWSAVRGGDVPAEWNRYRRVVEAGLHGADAVVAPTQWMLGELQRLCQLDRERLAQLRSRAAVFAAPALYEPFGLGVLEAALSGCSLVLGDIPSQRELWDGAARFVDPRDPEALSTALRDALLAPHPAVARAERFSVQEMAAGYEALYAELARQAVAA